MNISFDIDIDLFLLYIAAAAFLKAFLDAGARIMATTADPNKKVVEAAEPKKKELIRLKLRFERGAMWVSLLGTGAATIAAAGRIIAKPGNDFDPHAIGGFIYAVLIFALLFLARRRARAAG